LDMISNRNAPSYWETLLTDNGLGLENMHITYVFYSP